MNRSSPTINGEILYQARMRLGYSQADIERLTALQGCRVDNSNLSKMERGLILWRRPSKRRDPRARLVLASVLGITAEELFAPCGTCGQPWSAACMDHGTAAAAPQLVRPDAECARCGTPWSPDHVCQGSAKGAAA